MLEIARKVCAELEGSTTLIITQQPLPLHTSHFTAEVKDQMVVSGQTPHTFDYSWSFSSWGGLERICTLSFFTWPKGMAMIWQPNLKNVPRVWHCGAFLVASNLTVLCKHERISAVLLTVSDHQTMYVISLYWMYYILAVVHQKFGYRFQQFPDSESRSQRRAKSPVCWGIRLSQTNEWSSRLQASGFTPQPATAIC